MFLEEPHPHYGTVRREPADRFFSRRDMRGNWVAGRSNSRGDGAAGGSRTSERVLVLAHVAVVVIHGHPHRIKRRAAVRHPASGLAAPPGRHSLPVSGRETCGWRRRIRGIVVRRRPSKGLLRKSCCGAAHGSHPGGRHNAVRAGYVRPQGSVRVRFLESRCREGHR